MNYLDQRYHKRELRAKRNYEIDATLYDGLVRLTEIYEASVTELVNAAIEYLIQTEDISIFENGRHGNTVLHALLVRNSNIAGLDHLRNKYGINIKKLVNIAIRNLILEAEQGREER